MLDRFASAVSRAGNGARRLRFRRFELRRLPPVEIRSDVRQADTRSEWLPAVRIGARTRAAFSCGVGSRISYDVTLPPHASVRTWCACVADGSSTEDVGGVEFEIQVRSQQSVTSSRYVVPAAGQLGRQWQLLRVDAPEPGPARIVLITRLVDPSAPGHGRVLWGDPCVEVPRGAADYLSVARTAISESGLRGLWQQALPANSERLYRLWVRQSQPSRETLQRQREWSLNRARSFCLITFVDDGPGWRADRTAASLRAQSYPGWEWVLVAAEADVARVEALVARTSSDQRVRVAGVPRGASRAEAWNRALDEARAEFAGVLGPHDLLAPSALYEMAVALERHPDCDLLYSDEDRLSRRHRRYQPCFKPDWSPELLLSSNYIGRLAMVRVAAARAVDGFRRCDHAEEWDLFLRLSRSGALIRRVPRCLYHRAEADALEGLTRPEAVVRDHCRALGLSVTATTADGSRAIWDIQGEPTVSIVIPNRNAARIIRQCVTGLLHRTSYRHVEIVIVDNNSTDPEVLEFYRSLESDPRVRVVPFDRPFNFSAACNRGAAASRGDLLLFLNNDIEVIDADWLGELVRWVQLPAIGVAGAKLLYPDGTIQHAGVVFGIGLVGHIFARAPEGSTGLFGSSESCRNYLAVTGACQMMRREVFDRLGGFDERFRISFSDVVFCLEAWRAGYRVVYAPHARLVHHESYTRKRDDSAQDMELLARYLQEHAFVEDPFLHPELNPKSFVPSLRMPFDPVPQQVVRDYVDRVLAAAAH